MLIVSIGLVNQVSNLDLRILSLTCTPKVSMKSMTKKRPAAAKVAPMKAMKRYDPKAAAERLRKSKAYHKKRQLEGCTVKSTKRRCVDSHKDFRREVEASVRKAKDAATEAQKERKEAAKQAADAAGSATSSKKSEENAHSAANTAAACLHAINLARKFEVDGYCIISDVLQPTLCKELLGLVDSVYQNAMQGDTSKVYPIHAAEKRLCLKLPMDLPVHNALQELLKVPSLRNLLEGSVTKNAKLYDLTCVVSEPGAAAQPPHPDTTSKLESHRLVSIFVALQPVNEAMGPLNVYPGTHKEEMYSSLQRLGSAERAQRLKVVTAQLSCGAGDVIVMDSRLWHCGGANNSAYGARRRVFCASWFRPASICLDEFRNLSGATSALLDKERGKWELSDFMPR